MGCGSTLSNGGTHAEGRLQEVRRHTWEQHKGQYLALGGHTFLAWSRVHRVHRLHHLHVASASFGDYLAGPSNLIPEIKKQRIIILTLWRQHKQQRIHQQVVVHEAVINNVTLVLVSRSTLTSPSDRGWNM